MNRRLLGIAAIVLAGLGALAVRVVLEGRAALAEGDVAVIEKRSSDALAAWERAARWYLPGAPHVDEAYDRMREVARRDRSLPAWRAIRSAALATRSLWTPHADDLAEADTMIALLAAADPQAAIAGGTDVATRLAWHQRRLAGDPRPDRSAAALAILGIIGWLAGLALLIRRGVDDGGRLMRRPALVGVTITLGGIAAWALGLYSA